MTTPCALCGHETVSDQLDTALFVVGHEVDAAASKYPALNSPHEGYAVIREELDELWEEIKANRGRSEHAHDEAKQVAAMAIRYMLDLVEEQSSD